MSGAYNQYKVILPWSMYHNLDEYGRAEIVQVVINQNELAHMDEVREFANLQDARECAQAFNDLCVAAWTPNQDYEERIANGEIIRQSREILSRLK